MYLSPALTIGPLRSIQRSTIRLVSAEQEGFREKSSQSNWLLQPQLLQEFEKRALQWAPTKPNQRTIKMAADSFTVTYDSLGRIHIITYLSGKTITYTYDAAGNRTSVVST
ncbi:MAG: RHS repeat domain-containing protein [Candidatus Melainabacteria bacterium]|nr:RHS repeat domain-containing protein [Candidatus Melainabacteria bacterium]